MDSQKGDLALKAFDAVAALKAAKDLENLDAIVAPLFSDMGLPCFAASRFYSRDACPSQEILFGKPDHSWADEYTSQGYAQKCNIAQEILENNRPYTWREVTGRGKLTSGSREILNKARDHGFIDGLFLPIGTTDGSYAAVALCAELALEDPFVRTTVEVLASYYGSEGMRLLHGRKPKRAPLSGRQRDCLAWVRHGKSSADIAEILGLSISTVDGYIAEACRKLGVRTRVQAAVEACLQGLIDGRGGHELTRPASRPLNYRAAPVVEQRSARRHLRGESGGF